MSNGTLENRNDNRSLPQEVPGCQLPREVAYGLGKKLDHCHIRLATMPPPQQRHGMFEEVAQKARKINDQDLMARNSGMLAEFVVRSYLKGHLFSLYHSAHPDKKPDTVWLEMAGRLLTAKAQTGEVPMAETSLAVLGP